MSKLNRAIIIMLLVMYYISKGNIRYLSVGALSIYILIKNRQNILNKLKNLFDNWSKNKEKCEISQLIKNKYNEYILLGIFIIPIIYYEVQSIMLLLIGQSTFSIVYIKELLFVIIPILVILLIDIEYHNKKNYIIQDIFYSVIIAFLLQSVILNLGYILQNFMNKDRPFGLFENHILTQALVYFLLYYLYKKDTKNSIIALVLIILGNKRVVAIGVLLSLIPVIIMNLKKITNKMKCIINISYLLVVQLIFIYFLKSGLYDYLMFALGIDDKWRGSIWRAFYPDFSMKPDFFGHGMGYVIHKLQIMGNEWYPYLYNDPLKFFIELGLIGFIVFFILKSLTIVFFIKTEKRYFTFINIAFSFFITVVFFDNLTFYQEYLFLFYAVIYFSFKEYKNLKQIIN